MTSSKMDEELRKAALRGDVDFLKYCVESNKPIEYYLTSFPMEEEQSGRCHYGNIFHMATMENQEEFIREAMGILPQEAKQQLLVQPGDEVYKYNPLHVAAFVEECAVEIYKMDTELISDMPSDRGSSLVYEAVHTKMSKLALVILRSPHPISCGGGNDGYTPFHSIHFIEGSVIESKKNVLFLAVEAQCHTVAEEILKIIDNKGRTQLLTNHQKLNILHLAPLCTDYEGPLHLALRNKREDLGLYILSLLLDDQIMDELLDNYKPEHAMLFLAIQNNCSEVAKDILGNLDKRSRTKYLKDSSTGWNILHLATRLTDEGFGTSLVNEAPEFITEQDNNKQSPWDTAYETGCAWFIKAVLKKDPSVFNRAPLAWIKACEHGHVPALLAFIEHNPRAFRYLCIEKKDSPLHHIKLTSLIDYEDFLKNPYNMEDLINLQDSQGVTPLHKAIQDDNLFLTETLLSIDKINYDIKDDGNNSAIDLLAQKCAGNQAWV
uniref:Uncharacterized protein n=1 Tax=Chenopodium quinoa TaxID=63459 RepID=A0A803MH44_CHEQI